MDYTPVDPEFLVAAWYMLAFPSVVFDAVNTNMEQMSNLAHFYAGRGWM